MYYSDEDIKEKKEALLVELRRNFTHTTADGVVEALSAFIDAKIDMACQDLYDRIKQRGQYDPDY